MTPIKIDIVKNPEKAPSMGAKFGQDVEPTGTYVTKSSRIPNGWVGGTAILQNPLFVNVNQDNLIQYKRDLAQQYKAKGNALTKKLMSNGHDALITKYSDGSFGEIVLFPNANFILDKKRSQAIGHNS